MKYIDWDLMKAALEGDIALVKQCLAEGANPMLSNRLGYTALIVAAQSSHENTNEIVKLLLPISDVEHRDKNEKNALNYAKFDEEECTASIIQAYIDANPSALTRGDQKEEMGTSSIYEELWEACESSDIKAVENCLKRGANPDFDGHLNSESALFNAANWGNAKMMTFLLSVCNCEVVNDKGETPLMIAATRRNKVGTEVVRVLLPYSDLRRKNYLSETALDTAKKRDFQPTVGAIETYLLSRAEQQELGDVVGPARRAKTKLSKGM